MSSGPNVIAISVGNTRTAIGLAEDGELTDTRSLPSGDLPKLLEAVKSAWSRIAERDRPAIALASVDEPTARRLRSAVEDQLGVTVYRLGEDLPIPVGRELDPETITGDDRLLAAAAAYDALKQACIVVDAGTAVTVDFVDGEGTFHGGAIAPGASMQLAALHAGTDALPEVAYARPDAGEAFGRSTGQAMLIGVHEGIRGMVWRLVERYAQAYGAFPTVLATGGDAESLFEGDELVQRIVPDLALRGIVVAARHALAADVEDGA